jgi:hypothetical protein
MQISQPLLPIASLIVLPLGVNPILYAFPRISKNEHAVAFRIELFGTAIGLILIVKLMDFNLEDRCFAIRR